MKGRTVSNKTQSNESTAVDGNSLFGSLDKAKGKLPHRTVEERTPVKTSPRTASDLLEATDNDESANSDNPPSKNDDTDTTDWKKRYDDLKKHYDKSVVPLREQITERDTELEELRKQVKISKIPEIPQSEEELAVFAKKFPDVYKAVISIARKELLNNVAEHDAELSEVQNKLKKIEKSSLLLELSKHHPDAAQIKSDPEFIAWYDDQTPTLQALFNSSHLPDLIEGLNLYKMAKGIKTNKDKRKEEKEAATLVDTKNSSKPNKDEKRQWLESEVAKMSAREYAFYEADIDAAVREGRFVYGS